MAKEAKLSEFEKGEITTLKIVGKSQRKISKALGRIKTFICNYLKSPNKYLTPPQKKTTSRSEKLSPQFKRRILREVKKKTSSTSNILESLVDSPCSNRTIRRHSNNEKSKHKEIIPRPRLTMKYKKK